LYAGSDRGQAEGMGLMDEIHVVERDEQPFYTVETLARRLVVTPRTVKNMIRDGEIASYRFRGCRRIDKADVDSFLASHRDERRQTA
jgi:excisionase family DNA binding protein